MTAQPTKIDRHGFIGGSDARGIMGSDEAMLPVARPATP